MVVVVVLLLPFLASAAIFAVSFFAPSAFSGITLDSLLSLALGAMLLFSLALLVRAVYGILMGQMSVSAVVRWFFLALAGIGVVLVLQRGLQQLAARGPMARPPWGTYRGSWWGLPSIDFNDWTTVAVIWVAVLLLTAMIGQSSIVQGARRRIGVLGPVGALLIAWAIFADAHRIPYGQTVPPITPEFLAVWGLATLGVLPLLFVLMGGLHTHGYHPSWAPFAMLTKLTSFAASIISIWSFYAQYSW
jgi:hypothetical protein